VGISSTSGPTSGITGRACRDGRPERIEVAARTKARGPFWWPLGRASGSRWPRPVPRSSRVRPHWPPRLRIHSPIPPTICACSSLSDAAPDLPTIGIRWDRREAYFWALIAACGAFVAGAAFSLRDGINQLIHPSATSSFAVAYVVIAISTVLDLVSIRESAGALITRGRRYSRSLLQESQVTSDPTLRAVFVEEAVSVSGDGIAFVALALNQVTGSSAPQGVAAVLIGLALIRISLRLIKRSHDFLVGVWVLRPGTQQGDAADLTQPIRPVEGQRMQALRSAYPGVTGIRELLVNFIGPGRVWIVARVEIDNDLRGAQVESLVRGIDSRMRRESESIYRVDVVPIGGGHVGDPRSSVGERSRGEPGQPESSPHRAPGAGGRLTHR